MADFVRLCEEAARAGGAVLLDWVGRIQAREKGPADLVTEADLASQEVIRKVLLGAQPDFDFVGEEDPPEQRLHGEYRWIVDPLDGTTNYVHQFPGYAVSVALAKGDSMVAGAVFDPVAKACFAAAAGQGAFLNGHRIKVSGIKEVSAALVAASFAAKVVPGSVMIDEFVRVLLAAQSVRRLGSASLNLCYVATGWLDAYWARETKVWDVAAGALIVREAGGTITGLAGGPFTLSDPRFVAAATPELHAQLHGLLNPLAG
jgi:myo-inositol-1(or 4)-monophosphatase